MSRPILYEYWRSSAAYRVRIALNLKGVDYESRQVDLRAGAQNAPDYRAVNPFGLVPMELLGQLVRGPDVLGVVVLVQFAVAG